MTSRVLVIGIDSMDCELVRRFQSDLPNLRDIEANSPNIRLKSVFPPDSDTAWASIYTGKNPARHGVLTFIDPLEKAIDIQTMEGDVTHIIGKTFWDYAGHFGLRSCVLFPHITFPAWEVNGFMVSRSRVHSSIRTYPEKFNLYDLSKLDAPSGVPSKDYRSIEQMVNQFKNLVKCEQDFFIRISELCEWDLLFCYSSALDAIQHYLWNFYDPQSPDYVPDNPFRDVIREFYCLYDEMVGALSSNIGEDTAVIIISDHGHSGRPHTLININEILRKKGFISAKNTQMNRMSSFFSNKAIEFITRYNLGWITSRIFSIFPDLKHVTAIHRSFSPSLSLAYVTDLSGIKSYTYGGIKINRNLVSPKKYDEIRNHIIRILKTELEGYYQWILKREELYDGPYLNQYPDILIQLKEGYGLGNIIFTPISSKAYTSSIVPGSHRGDTPIFYLYNSGRKVVKKEICLMHVAPTILDLLGIDYTLYNYEEESILEKRERI